MYLERVGALPVRPLVVTLSRGVQMSTTEIYGRLIDAGGMINNVRHPAIGCEFNADDAATTDPLTDDAPSLQRYLNRTGVGAEASFPKGAGVFSNLRLPASTRLQGLGCTSRFCGAGQAPRATWVREDTSAVKVTLRDGSVTIRTGGGATSTNFAIPADGIFEVTPAQGSGTDVRAFYYAP